MVVQGLRRTLVRVVFVVFLALFFAMTVVHWRRMPQSRSPNSVQDPVCRPDMKVRPLPPLPEDDWAMLKELFTYLTKPHPAACHKKARFGGLVTRTLRETREVVQDGQKFVCMDPEFTLHTSERCLVYSFGIATDWTFDYDMERFGCHVYAFDPSVKLSSGYKNGTISFLQYGIGAEDHVNDKGWEIRTLDTFVEYLGHQDRTIHYLKMDVEFAEFEVLRQQVMHMRDSPLARNVEQLGVELHMTLFLPVWEHMSFYREMYKTFWVMQLMGYYPFYFENNPIIEADMDVPGLDEKFVSAMEVVWLKSRCVNKDV